MHEENYAYFAYYLETLFFLESKSDATLQF